MDKSLQGSDCHCTAHTGPDFLIEHGWLCTPNGEIVDPTLALFGQRYMSTRYFPGNAFTSADITYCYSIEQLLDARHVTPLSYRIRWAASEHEAARLRAYASR